MEGAPRLAWQRAARPKPAKLAVNRALREIVERDLARKYSPAQIAARLRMRFPTDPEMWVSTETIYQSLYVTSRGALKRELTACLRTGRTLRKPGRRTGQRRNRIPDMVNIAQRPQEADDRAIPGHWEGDLLLGKNNKSAIGTLVERATGYAMLVHLPDGYKTEPVVPAIATKIKTLPESLRRSLTWDQGIEMRDWKQISLAADIDIYFWCAARRSVVSRSCTCFAPGCRAGWFLSYEITTQHANQRITGGRRMANGTIQLRVPRDVIKAKCARYMQRGKPARRPELMNEEDHSIIRRYGSEYRGIVQYYLLAGDVHRLNRLHWVMVTSLLKTLAGKYDSSVSKMAHRYGARIDTPHGPRKCLQASVDRGEGSKPLVATFGGIPLRRQKHAVLWDRESVRPAARGKELIHRLLAGTCELCGQKDQVRVHQIRTLSDLDKPGQPQQPEWMTVMAKRRRKTPVICAACHANIASRQPTATTTEPHWRAR